ncbi:PrpF domain-containing protein, partial [Streptomyces asiaticus]
MLRVRGEMIRGGTSKCWIFDHHEVVATGVDADTLLLAAFNAADPRQIDGVGGASSTTSKAAIVPATASAAAIANGEPTPNTASTAHTANPANPA